MAWARKEQRDNGRSLLLFPCTLISACPEEEKGDLDGKSQKEEGKWKREEGRRSIIDFP